MRVHTALNAPTALLLLLLPPTAAELSQLRADNLELAASLQVRLPLPPTQFCGCARVRCCTMLRMRPSTCAAQLPAFRDPITLRAIAYSLSICCLVTALHTL